MSPPREGTIAFLPTYIKAFLVLPVEGPIHYSVPKGPLREGLRVFQFGKERRKEANLEGKPNQREKRKKKRENK